MFRTILENITTPIAVIIGSIIISLSLFATGAIFVRGTATPLNCRTDQRQNLANAARMAALNAANQQNALLKAKATTPAIIATTTTATTSTSSKTVKK